MNYQKKMISSYVQVMDKYHIGSLLAKLCVYNHWNDEQIRNFLQEPIPYDPKQHKIAQRIKERFIHAKNKQEKVFIFGDYDTDGICATTMLVKLLRSIGIQAGFYIPNRLQEGYGLNLERTKQAIDKGYQLIVTVDNGVKAHDSLAYAKTHGVDVIVMDHHTIEEDVNCYALWHPTTIDTSCQYLCGAGCVLQMAKVFEVNLDEYLPLACVATIGDMMVLEGENRWIVRHGLKLINEGRHVALNCLLKNLPINEEDIAFQIVPKLNAVGRLADRANVNQVVNFLLCEQMDNAQTMALQIQAINDERKKMTTVHEEMVDPTMLEKNFMIVYHEDFHPGIVGLLANRLCKTYNKPVMVLSSKEDCYVGSVRSVEGLDLMDALGKIAHLFEAFGGHKQAVGLTFKKEHLLEIEEYVNSLEYEVKEDCTECLLVDDVDLQWSNIQELYAYGPYGQGVELPLLWYEHPRIQYYRFMKKETYMKWQLPTVEAVWFSNTNTYQDFVNENELVFIGKLGNNTFRGITNYVLQLEYVRK